jgi:hypothetical protein
MSVFEDAPRSFFLNIEKKRRVSGEVSIKKEFQPLRQKFLFRPARGPVLSVRIRKVT